jgi:sRNA-binding regulator protein Hfq
MWAVRGHGEKVMAILEIIAYKIRRRGKMTDEKKATTDNPAPKQTGPQFIPTLKGKKVVICLVSGGQPVTGIVGGYNPYDVLVQITKRQVMIFKHSHRPRICPSNKSSR